MLTKKLVIHLAGRMLSEENKFKAETLRMTGVAFLTPLARVFLDPFGLFTERGPLIFLVLVIYSSALAFVGLLCIARCSDIIDGRKRDL